MLGLHRLSEGIALCAAAAATVTDLRYGTIPNWLTLPALAAGLVLGGLKDGWWGLASAVGGCLLCGAVPCLLFCKRAMGGGDVKLLAGIGALVGPLVGLEMQLTAYLLATLYALAALAHRGRLLAVFGNVGRMALRPWLAPAKRLEIDMQSLHSMRFGAAILAAVLLCLVWRYAAAI